MPKGSKWDDFYVPDRGADKARAGSVGGACQKQEAFSSRLEDGLAKGHYPQLITGLSNSISGVQPLYTAHGEASEEVHCRVYGWVLLQSFGCTQWGNTSPSHAATWLWASHLECCKYRAKGCDGLTLDEGQVLTKASLSPPLFPWTEERKYNKGSWHKLKSRRDRSPVTDINKADLTWEKLIYFLEKLNLIYFSSQQLLV